MAESITGGMIGELVTRVPGSSQCFMGSIVSYSNDMKTNLLRVSEQTLQEHGAVSHQCAQEMAIGARSGGSADIGLSVTGIAGPDGGTPEKPVGTFYVGMATTDAVSEQRFSPAWASGLGKDSGCNSGARHASKVAKRDHAPWN